MLYARDYRQRAWNHLSGNWTTPVLATLIFSLLSGLIGSFNRYYGFGTIISLIIFGPFMLGFAIISLNVVRGVKPELEQLFAGFKNFLSAFLLYLLNSIFIALWSLLLIVPGIIKAVAYSLSFCVLRDNPQMTANEARIKSMELTEGHKWSLFCLYVSFIGWILLCALTFGILWFWVGPYIQTATAEFYVSLISGERSGATTYNFGTGGKSVFGEGYYRNGGGQQDNINSGDQADTYKEYKETESFDKKRDFDEADSLRGKGYYDGEEEFTDKAESDNSPFSDFDKSDDNPFEY